MSTIVCIDYGRLFIILTSIAYTVDCMTKTIAISDEDYSRLKELKFDLRQDFLRDVVTKLIENFEQNQELVA